MKFICWQSLRGSVPGLWSKTHILDDSTGGAVTMCGKAVPPPDEVHRLEADVGKPYCPRCKAKTALAVASLRDEEGCEEGCVWDVTVIFQDGAEETFQIPCLTHYLSDCLVELADEANRLVRKKVKSVLLTLAPAADGGMSPEARAEEQEALEETCDPT